MNRTTSRRFRRAGYQFKPGEVDKPTTVAGHIQNLRRRLKNCQSQPTINQPATTRNGASSNLSHAIALSAGCKCGMRGIESMIWTETFDFDGNSMLEAASPYTDSEGSTEFYWRLKQRFVKNRIEWYEDSDAELIPDPESPRSWLSLEVAKTQIANEEAEIISDRQRQMGCEP
jgi:hypothetical protein